MKQLEKALELPDDSLNELSKLMEKWKNRLTLDNLRLTERYLEGSLELILHLRSEAPGYAGDYCAVLRYDASARLAGDVKANGERSVLRSAPTKNNAGIRRRVEDDGQEAVFAEIVKFLELPEVIVPTLVRLQSLDETYRSRVDSLYHSAILGFFLGSHFVDRKTRVGIGLPTVGQDKLPSEMVETGTQLMDGLACDQRDFLKGIDGTAQLKDNLFSLRVVIGHDSIRAGTRNGSHPLFNISDVVFGPFDFQADSLESVGHD
jgi:hypothetical protein